MWAPALVLKPLECAMYSRCGRCGADVRGPPACRAVPPAVPPRNTSAYSNVSSLGGPLTERRSPRRSPPRDNQRYNHTAHKSCNHTAHMSCNRTTHARTGRGRPRTQHATTREEGRSMYLASMYLAAPSRYGKEKQRRGPLHTPKTHHARRSRREGNAAQRRQMLVPDALHADTERTHTALFSK